MSSFFDGWISSERADQDAIKLKRVYIDICDGNLVDGVLFSQIMYWHTPNKHGKPRLKVKRDGHLWLAKRYEDWHEECRINEHTARKSIKRMVVLGLLEKRSFHFSGTPTVHIRVVYERFEELVKEVQAATSSLNCPLVSDTTVLKGQMQSLSKDVSYTETTTETTTEIKDSAATPPAIQPHIALIDAYWSALPGGKPIKDDYPRHVKLATKMVDAGVTTEQIAKFMTALYDPKTDVFEYKRWHDKVIPLENVAELLPVWWAKHKPKPVQRYVLNGPANFQEHFEKRMREINSDEGQQQIKDYLVAQGRGHEFDG